MDRVVCIISNSVLCLTKISTASLIYNMVGLLSRGICIIFFGDRNQKTLHRYPTFSQSCLYTVQVFVKLLVVFYFNDSNETKMKMKAQVWFSSRKTRVVRKCVKNLEIITWNKVSTLAKASASCCLYALLTIPTLCKKEFCSVRLKKVNPCY